MKIDWPKVDQPDVVFSRFASRRSVPLAVEAGLEILRKGGNAADAAVATSATLNVTEPCSCGIGGDAFCLFYDAKEKTVKAFNGSGRSPASLTIEQLRNQGVNGNSIPATNLNSVTVPGCAAAWVDTVEQLGSGKLSMAEILDPAIRLAEGGPRMKMWNLAQTFREVAKHGKDGFYKGRIAEAIVKLITSNGGVMTLEDLANHETDFVEPIKYTFNEEVTVYECPPNGQGLTALIALGILDNLEASGKIGSLLEMEHNSAEYLHVLVEAMRQYFVTDPNFSNIPNTCLHAQTLYQEYLTSRAKLIDTTKSNPKVVHGNPVHSSDTVYFTVSDQWGNACSYIQSNYAGFGTAEGGKRPYHTIIPAMALRGDELFLSYGVMGGFMQPQGHVQVLLNILRGFGVQAALDAPRFCISAGSPETEGTSTGDPGTSTARCMGHDARVAKGLQRALFGRGQVIQKLNDKSGTLVWAAGSDPRADGHASAQI
ncbi:gamma-glutamyltranspeptidase [Epithele typhae]|uniref:gamma-glutamyltranspeptidase n=1 Tax=Epithele typhae TaxID=378194 RepID=UPI002008D11A|nr:gamma-glutamyltranspeptidase [Epithele typhae]KAH9944125.1 gamma-glutamyltranspeptidase [Epithele typhae]